MEESKESKPELGGEWRIAVYQAQDASSPVREYVESLPDEVKRRFQQRVQYLRMDGLNASQDVAKKLEDDLWELRLPHSDGNPRILFFASVGRRIILLHGFNKQGKATDKVPESEKLIARKRCADFKARDALEQQKQADQQTKTKTKQKRGKRK